MSEVNNIIIMPCTYEEALQIEDDFLQFAKEVQERNSKNEIKTSLQLPIKRVRILNCIILNNLKKMRCFQNFNISKYISLSTKKRFKIFFKA